MRRGWVGAPMLCLCTTLGQDGLTARLLVVPSERAPPEGEHGSNHAEGRSRIDRSVAASHADRSAAALLTRAGRLPAFPSLAGRHESAFHRVNGFEDRPVTWNALELVTAPGLNGER
jgi:hypothetical protein